MYRVYVTDCLRMITENTAKFAGGSMIKERFFEIIHRQNKPKDEQNGNKIVADIIKRAKLEVV